MFVFPSYSRLFTMGLLAEPAPSPARAPVEPPRSIPASDEVSAIYFTLQAGKRDSVELRSFLYLDLADNKWHAPSHRRKYSALSKSTSWTCTADVKSIYDFARTEKPVTTTIPPAPAVPARRRASKESLRSIPSPKPAPSTTLPDLPVVPPSPPAASPSTSSATHVYPTVVGAALSPPSGLPRSVSLRSESVSSHVRRKSRMDALACLEGRSRAPNRVPRSSSLRNNFMSFSDDEDDKSMVRRSSASKPVMTPVVHAEDSSAFADVEDEVDVIPVLPRKHTSAEHAKPARPARPARKRRSTIESWFPLKSFIDLKDDDLSSWNWRSFIEIGGVA